jgi:NADH-quinone oxidoreductase subunit N
MSLNYYSLFILLVLFKFVVFFTLIKVIYSCFYPVIFYLQNIFFIICSITLLIGAMGIYLQYNIRKFLTYSTLTHSSYIVSSLFCDSPYGLYSAMVYLIVYLISTSAFLFFGSFTYNLSKKKSIFSFLELAEIGYYKRPYFVVVLLLFSMAGLPPLAGFWVKLYVLECLVVQNTFFSWVLVFIIIVTTCITTIGYLRIIKIFFLKTKCVGGDISLYHGSYFVISRLLSFFFIFFFLVLICWNPETFLEFYLYFRLNF